ncbi:MAG: tetratricopeptide (TPR) repeat protein [Gammaproteobacteria bacterium]|jgi:tetratricopeptide (TPR) repeat protein
MIKRIIYITTLILCCSCSTNFIDNSALLEQRSPVAKSLENKQHFAEALTQWKILHLAYPKDQMVNDHIRRLEFLISERVIEQLGILDKAKKEGNQKLERIVYLKILALEPNNQIAMEELRKFEWQFAIEETSSKTANIKKYFVESQEEAKISIQLTKYLEQGEQFTHDKKYKRLLQLADKFEGSYPTHAQPNDYRILAYTKLGESHQQQKRPEEAIEYYQQAIKTAALDNKKLPETQKKIDTLSGSISDRYLNLANKAFRTNLDKAIEYFELSLKHQPNNTEARQLMQRAIKIRQNLMKIKKLNANSD